MLDKCLNFNIFNFFFLIFASDFVTLLINFFYFFFKEISDMNVLY
jgi:hypothetical protein